MPKYFVLLLGLVCFNLSSFSQTGNAAIKAGSISTGIGLGGVPKKMKAAGKYFWLQLDYKFIEHFSIALEFENFAYKQMGYFETLPLKYPNEIKVINNNFSFLVKYHITSKRKLKIAVASGWTYNISNNDYYLPPYDSGSTIWTQSITSSSDYRIPLLLEVTYPVCKAVSMLTRVKYNLNTENGNNYSAGIGLSLKL